MYRDYYKLSAEPFRLTPDPLFVSAHQSYLQAQALMQRALEQGDGMLVVTGRAGTGKTTLIEHFLAQLSPDEVLSASVVAAPLETENLVRMVAYAFGLDAKHMDQATLLCELQAFLTGHDRSSALLIIDEAHNLSVEAFEEVRTLINMHDGPRPLLQVFLVGQEKLHEKLHTPEMQQIHQQIMATCSLKPLSLQETHDYILHRLHSAGWRGNPAVVTYTFILVHRFSQGLPRYISKLCARLLEQGAQEHQHKIDPDDVVRVADEMHSQLLLPLPCDATHGTQSVLPLIQGWADSKALPTAQRIEHTLEELRFLEGKPTVVQVVPEGVLKAAQAQQARKATGVDADAPKMATALNVPGDGLNAPAWNRLELLWRSVKPFLVKVTRAFASGARLLCAGLLRLMALARRGAARSQRLDNAAQTLQHGLQNNYSRVRNLLVDGFSSCREWLALSVNRVGAQTLLGCGALLLLVIAGSTLLGTDPEEQQQNRAPELAAEISPEEEVGNQQLASAPIDPEEESELSASQELTLVEPQSVYRLVALDPPVKSEESIDENRLAQIEAVEVLPEKPAETLVDTRIADLLALAEEAMSKDQLRIPEGKSAWSYYSRILELEPDNEAAQEGMQAIGVRYSQLAAWALQRQQFDKAESLVQRGLSVAAADSKLLALQQDIAVQRSEWQARQEQEALLALRDAELASAIPPEQAEEEPAGLFGTLKRFFKGSETAR